MPARSKNCPATRISRRCTRWRATTMPCASISTSASRKTVYSRPIARRTHAGSCATGSRTSSGGWWMSNRSEETSKDTKIGAISAQNHTKIAKGDKRRQDGDTCRFFFAPNAVLLHRNFKRGPHKYHAVGCLQTKATGSRNF